MGSIPTTSITLLKDLASAAGSVRWTEFYSRYEGPLRRYLQTRYPSVEEDDVIQETMLALMRCLPNYHYTPDVNGHFHSYLTGIAKHKAEDVLRRQARHAAAMDDLRHQERLPSETPADDTWKDTVFQAAVDQLMADSSVSARTREVFRHVALLHEPPEQVAALFGITRNNVDQIKKRMITRLSELAQQMADRA